nr:MAG TPA: hypothetical protein [Inoviridae sp.]
MCIVATLRNVKFIDCLIHYLFFKRNNVISPVKRLFDS